MKSHLVLFALVIAFVVTDLLAAEIGASRAEPPLAFSGALGFAAHTQGGRGKEIRHVTTLQDSGAGSLRETLGKGNCLVVFDVGGEIVLDKILKIPSHVTIAGQTAPGMGIALVGHEVSLSDSQNVVCRFVRFRQGLAKREEKKYALGMHASKDVIIDHCSIEFGRWDNIGMTASQNITIQNCIIGPGIAPQSFGCLCESDNVTFARNLWIENQSRNPKAKGKIQFVNNVVYAWGTNGFVGGHSGAEHFVDLVGNYFIAGRKSAKHAASQFAATDKVYAKENFVDLDADGVLQGRAMTDADFAGASMQLEPWSPISFEVLSPERVVDFVVNNAGCSLRRDALDQRLVADARSFGLKGASIKDPAELDVTTKEVLGGAALLDTDQDGIPDAWETKHGLNPNDSTDAGKTRARGTSPLDDYLDELAESRSSQ